MSRIRDNEIDVGDKIEVRVDCYGHCGWIPAVVQSVSTLVFFCEATFPDGFVERRCYYIGGQDVRYPGGD